MTEVIFVQLFFLFHTHCTRLLYKSNKNYSMLLLRGRVWLKVSCAEIGNNTGKEGWETSLSEYTRGWEVPQAQHAGSLHRCCIYYICIYIYMYTYIDIYTYIYIFCIHIQYTYNVSTYVSTYVHPDDSFVNCCPYGDGPCRERRCLSDVLRLSCILASTSTSVWLWLWLYVRLPISNSFASGFSTYFFTLFFTSQR